MRNLTKLPFGLPGQIYRSPMPFARFDRGQTAWKEFQAAAIDTVVMLIEEGEDLAHAQHDLKALYQEAGLEVIHLPIVDFDIPDEFTDLDAALDQVIAQARSGKNIAVHCFAGQGRTGMFIAILARRILGMGGIEAIEWARQFFPAVETEAQEKVVIQDKG